jgi:ABC-2 type transport system permease protein
VSLVLFQVRHVNKAFWRNPASAFFTFVFPLMFLVIFTALLGDGRLDIRGHVINQGTYYVAEMATFAVISACYTNMAMSVAYQRDTGVLKRLHGTPLPAGTYLTARVVHALLVSLLMVALTATFGALLYDAQIPSGTSLLQFLVMLAVGSASFCALAFAITTLIPNVDAAPPLVNASILPVLFMSGVFIPLEDDAATWVIWVAKVFPVRHFANGMLAAFLGTPFSWNDVLVVGLWGLAGMAVAVRFFDWEPRT